MDKIYVKRYSAAFKQSVVREYEAGTVSVKNTPDPATIFIQESQRPRSLQSRAVWEGERNNFV